MSGTQENFQVRASRRQHIPLSKNHPGVCKRLRMASTSLAAQANGVEASSSRQQQQQVPLTLKTSIPGLDLPPTQYLVPTTFARSQLSTLVNKLLQQTAGLEQTIPFDFIADGSLLRESLDSWLESNGRSVEEGIELEYVKSTLPPRWAGAFEHDDWVASIDASRENTFLTASYDSCLRLFSYENTQEALLTYRVPSMSPSSPQSLVGARWLHSDLVATAGLDGAVRVWRLPAEVLRPSEATSEASASPQQLWWGSHHPIAPTKGSQSSTAGSASSSYGMAPSALTSLDVSADGKAILTASRDGSIAYWNLDDVAGQVARDDASSANADGDDDEDAKRKRRKGVNGKKGSTVSIGANAKRPTALLWHAPPVPSNTSGAATGPSYVSATNARVSQAIFDSHDSMRAISVGYDGKLIEWDTFAATKGGNPKLSVRQTSDSRAILSVACPHNTGSSSGARVVTGQMDRSICLWDLSSASSSATVVLPNAHAGPIYSVACHPQEPHLFATAGADGAVKIWDARSHKRALFSLQAPSKAGNANSGAKMGSGQHKLLACEWDRFSAEGGVSTEANGHIILAGGEDSTVNVFRQ
ncbi:unnamed protein product [Parajaminaea phylloscopi]